MFTDAERIEELRAWIKSLREAMRENGLDNHPAYFATDLGATAAGVKTFVERVSAAIAVACDNPGPLSDGALWTRVKLDNSGLPLAHQNDIYHSLRRVRDELAEVVRGVQ